MKMSRRIISWQFFQFQGLLVWLAFWQLQALNHFQLFELLVLIQIFQQMSLQLFLLALREWHPLLGKQEWQWQLGHQQWLREQLLWQWLLFLVLQEFWLLVLQQPQFLGLLACWLIQLLIYQLFETKLLKYLLFILMLSLPFSYLLLRYYRKVNL